MSWINKTVSALKPSATLEVKGTALSLKAQGIKVVDLSCGEPNIDTPEHIKAGAVEALRNGHTKYTAVPGIPELRKAIAKKFTEFNGIPTDWEDVIVSNGGKQALSLILNSVVEFGDEVIIPAPYWVSYPPMVMLAGGVPVVIDTCISDDFKITPDQLESALTEKTKLVILNSPSNPTGMGYSKQELVALGEVLKNRRVLVLSDEVYEMLVYGSFEFCSFGAACPDLQDRTITVNAFSKTYSMTGLRVGYATGPLEVIKACIKLQGQTTSNINSVAQWAALAALNGPQDFLVQLRRDFERRLDFSIDQILSISGFKISKRPDGAFYLFVDANEWIANHAELVSDGISLTKLILERCHVAVVPGEAFGYPNGFRISVACSDEELDQAMKGLASLA